MAEAGGVDLRLGFVDTVAIDNTAGAGTVALSGVCSVAAERRAARLLGAGGRGMVLKTLCVDGSGNKKAALMPRRLDGSIDKFCGCKAQVHRFIMHKSAA